MCLCLGWEGGWVVVRWKLGEGGTGGCLACV